VASAAILVFRRGGPIESPEFRQFFATAVEPEPLIIDHQFVILSAGPQSRELLIENQEPWFQGHIAQSPDSTGHRKKQRRHKTVIRWLGKQRGNKYEAS